MRCDQLKTLMHVYLDGQLPKPDRDEVESHIDSCEKCREDMRLLRTVHQSLSTQKPEMLPAGLTASIMARIKDMRRAPVMPEIRPVPLGLAAAAVLVIVLAAWPHVIQQGGSIISSVENTFEQPDVEESFVASWDAALGSASSYLAGLQGTLQNSHQFVFLTSALVSALLMLSVNTLLLRQARIYRTTD